MSRYLRARPDGVLDWLSVKPASLERRLFEYLLAAYDDVELNVPALAAALTHSSQSIARALFVLNRHSSIDVKESSSPSPDLAHAAKSQKTPRGIANLEQDLIDIAQTQGEILLASDDGFCIAQTGMSPEQAQLLAAHLPSDKYPTMSFQARLHFGENTLHFGASPGIDLKHPAMLKLGAHLLHGCHQPYAMTGNAS